MQLGTIPNNKAEVVYSTPLPLMNLYKINQTLKFSLIDLRCLKYRLYSNRQFFASFSLSKKGAKKG